MKKYEKVFSVVTHVGGHQFSNLTNCNITFSFFDPNFVANLFCGLRGPAFEYFELTITF